MNTRDYPVGDALAARAAELESKLAASEEARKKAEEELAKLREQEPHHWLWRFKGESQEDWRVSLGAACPTYREECEAHEFFAALVPPADVAELEARFDVEFRRGKELERKLAEQQAKLDTVRSLFIGGENLSARERAALDSLQGDTYRELTKLLAQAREEQRKEAMMQWQPIETAPKDGTKIIGWNAEFGARQTKMNFYGLGSIGYAEWERGEGTKESGWDWTEPKNNWGFSWNPTHWMPLPAAPQPERKDCNAPFA